MTTFRSYRFLRAALALLLMLAAPATAQVASTELFKPVVVVNGKAVTNYEVQQRMIMLKLFRTAGDIEAQAIDGLIDDRLRMAAAAQMDLALTDEEILVGETEFAGRANLERDQFIQALAGAGVARESFRDFVAAGLLWRSVVRERFGPLANVSAQEIEHAISTTSQRGVGVEILFSEIILPANTPAAAAQAERRATEILANAHNEGTFANYARRYSASASRARGGRVPDAVPLGNLPAAIAQAMLALPPGGVTQAFPIPNAIAIFQLRQIIETDNPVYETQALDYARFLIPGGRSEETLKEAAKIRAKVDTCNDLFAVAKGLPPERLTRDVRTPAEVPQDIALELAKLDAGESSTALTSGNALVFLMLCSRNVVIDTLPREEESDEPLRAANGAILSPGAAELPEANRQAVREQLINQQVLGYANGYLAELRANAIITYP